MNTLIDCILIIGAPIFGCAALPPLIEKLDTFLKSRKAANL